MVKFLTQGFVNPLYQKKICKYKTTPTLKKNFIQTKMTQNTS